MRDRFILEVRVVNEYNVATARCLVLNYCSRVFFSALEKAQLALIITELATNLFRHTRSGGKITCRIWPDNSGIDLAAIDDGPGIQDVTAALGNGYSTSGSLGGGLGAVLRLSDSFSLETSEQGTILKLTKSLKKIRYPSLDICVQTRPHPRAQLNGDGVYIFETIDWSMIGVFDALGHGTAAFETATILKHCLDEFHNLPLPQLIELCHKRMLSTRGAVIFLAIINRRTATLNYFSLGNVEGRLFSDNVYKKLLSQNGTLGINLPPIKITTLPWQPNSVLTITSDGIRSEWNLPDPACLHFKNLCQISWEILKTWGRENDDATIMIVRNRL